MLTLDRFWKSCFRHNTSSSISVPRFGTKNAFTTKLKSIEVGCLLHEFMNINEASKMATCDLAQRKLWGFLATLSVTSAVLSTLVS